MIARNRDFDPRRPARRDMVEARRNVAAALFRRRIAAPEGQAPPVSLRTGWIFLAWAIAVAVSYFVCGSWWSVGGR
jgi:hypothetical protein